MQQEINLKNLRFTSSVILILFINFLIYLYTFSFLSYPGEDHQDTAFSLSKGCFGAKRIPEQESPGKAGL